MDRESVVLITGAAGSTGPHVARAFAARGVRLAPAARRLEQAEALLDELGLDEQRGLPAAVDVTQAASVAEWVAAVTARWGRVDVLVNLAGGYQPGKPVHQMDESDLDFMFSLNARSAFLTCRAAIPHMLAQKRGKIINVGAKAALAAGRRSTAYAVSKAAVLRLTEALSAEVREHGINVNTVLPSTIDTPDNRAAMPNADTAKWVAPDDLAAVIVFLASDAAQAIHGAHIPVYGRGG
jgi:NAD(P)-dependent dehydrogenase (short-subunit alcohol dehydrogenase family)